jgi:hypothetical protein
MRIPHLAVAVAVVAIGATGAGCGGDDTTREQAASTPTNPPATTATTDPTTTGGSQPDAPPTPGLPGLDAAEATLIDGYLGWTELTTPPVASLRNLGSSAHRGRKRIWASASAAELRAGGSQRFPYPRGTVIVKEGRTGRDVTLIAVMEKVRDADPALGGWRYAEYTRPDGDSPFTKVGFPESGCAGCHQNANTTQTTDWVFYTLP